jgi:hypothetical protein
VGLSYVLFLVPVRVCLVAWKKAGAEKELEVILLILIRIFWDLKIGGKCLINKLDTATWLS